MKIKNLFILSVLLLSSAVFAEDSPFHCDAIISEDQTFDVAEVNEEGMGSQQSGNIVTTRIDHDTSLNLLEAIEDAFDEIESDSLEDICNFTKILKEKSIDYVPVEMKWTVTIIQDESNFQVTTCQYSCIDEDWAGQIRSNLNQAVTEIQKNQIRQSRQ